MSDSRAAITAKLFCRADILTDDNPLDLGRAVAAILVKAQSWHAAGMPMAALGDELLLTVAPALGVRLQMGQFAQLVDLDEEGQ